MPTTPAPEPAQPMAPGTPVPEASVRPVRYAVTCLPPEHRDYRHFTVWVQETRAGQWFVHGGYESDLFDVNGNRSWGPLPLEDRESWRARHHFDFETAVAIAKNAAPTLEVNGYTVTDILARADR